MRVSGYILFLLGISFIAVKLLIDLLIPIGVVMAILGAVLYFSQNDSKKVKVIKD